MEGGREGGKGVVMEGAGTYSENLPPASRLTNGFQPTKQGSPPLFLSLLLHLLHPSISEEGRSFLSISITLLPHLPEPCGEAENTSTLQQRRIHPELCVCAQVRARMCLCCQAFVKYKMCSLE